MAQFGQELHINPIKANRFDVDDFAGLLAKYEAQVSVQYMKLNSDLQYKVTVTRAKLKDAFVSWSTLENFVDGLTQALYNGAYIDHYNMTKALVSSAYASNQVQVEVISAVNSEANAKAFITKAREIYLNMQTPTVKFNAWRKVGGYGRDILTWSNPEDIVFLIRNDLASYIDVNTLSVAFNIDKTSLLGRIIYVNDFDQYDSEGTKIFDGSNIVGMIADKSWFRIKEQELTMDEFYNANNRCWTLFLNDVRMYQYSLFANAVVFATAMPQVDIVSMSATPNEVEVAIGGTKKVTLVTDPFPANNPTITVASSASGVATASISGKEVTITGVDDGTATITATAGNVTATISVTVPAAS